MYHDPNRSPEPISLVRQLYNVKKFEQVKSLILNKETSLIDNIDLLSLCCLDNNIDIAQLLIQHRQTPIAEICMENACFAGDVNMIEYLVSQKPDLLLNNETLMFHACAFGHLNAVKYLHNHNVPIVDDTYENFYIICNNNHYDILSYIIETHNLDLDHILAKDFHMYIDEDMEIWLTKRFELKKVNLLLENDLEPQPSQTYKSKI